MTGCRGHRVLACIGVALTALGALSTLLDPEYTIPLLKLSLAIISFSILSLILEASVTLLLFTILLLAPLALLEISPSMQPLLLPLTMIAPLAIGLATARLEVLIASLGVVIASLTLVLNQDLAVITIPAYMVLQAILAVLTTRRLHSMILLLALLTIPFGLIPALTASLLASLLVIAASGFIERVGCPFKVDSRVVFPGSIVSSTGIMTLSLWGLNDLTTGLWILGLLLVVSGVLVPTRLPRG